MIKKKRKIKRRKYFQTHAKTRDVRTYSFFFILSTMHTRKKKIKKKRIKKVQAKY